MCRSRSADVLVDPVGDALGGVAQLFHGPVGGVALGDVRGRGVIDQPLGQARGQHELAVGNGDEAVSERMEPEPGPARLADSRVEMLDGFEMPRSAGLGRKHPASSFPGEVLPLFEAALQNGGELTGDRELQRLAAFGVLDADGHGRNVDLGPGEGDHFGKAHAGVEPEAEGVSDDRVAHRSLEATVPAWQYFRRWLDASTARRVQTSPCCAPVLYRVAQFLEVQARPAVDGAEQLHGGVCLHPAGPFGQFLESLLDVAAVDLVEGAVKPVAEIPVNGAAVAGDGAVPALGSDRKPVLEGLAQGRDGTGARAIRERVLAQGDATEDLPCAAARLVGGDEAVTPDDDPPVRRLPAAVAGTVVDEVRAQAGRVNADAESGEPVVPCDVGAVLGLERVDGPRRERHPETRDEFRGRNC